MVNIALDPLSDYHVGYHLLHWLVSQSGAWYSKVNENLQDNLRSLETGVAVIDDILTPEEEEVPVGNQQHVDAEVVQFPQNQSGDHHLNILNQIINMNINYNRENNVDHRRLHGNIPPGQSMLISLTRLTFRFSRFASHVSSFAPNFQNFRNRRFRFVLIFAKKWTTSSFSLNNGNVESLF